MFLARYLGETLAAVLVILEGDTAYAHIGASSSRHRQAYAPYLIQWQIIRNLQAQGFRYYDFWGIAPEDQPDHPWAGFSFFKRGFGGQQVDYMHAQDLPFNSSYWLVYALETFKRRRRGLPTWSATK